MAFDFSLTVLGIAILTFSGERRVEFLLALAEQF